jgi:hypothetical protein
MPVYAPERLVGDLGLVQARPADDQPAVSDEVTLDAAANGQQRDPPESSSGL